MITMTGIMITYIIIVQLAPLCPTRGGGHREGELAPSPLTMVSSGESPSKTFGVPKRERDHFQFDNKLTCVFKDGVLSFFELN